MLKIFEVFTKNYYKRYFVILHIPTNLYVRTRFSIYEIAPVGFKLATKPTYFYYFPWNKWHKTKKLDRVLNGIDCFYLTEDLGSSAYKTVELEHAEFELIEVDRSQVE